MPDVDSAAIRPGLSTVRSRITIRRLMLVIAGIGVFLALLDSYPLTTIEIAFVLTLAALGWRTARRSPVLARWGFLACASWLNASLLVLYAYQPVYHNAVLLFLAALAFVPIVPGVGLAWAADGRGRTRWARVAIVAGTVALAVSMIETRWPLHLAFRLSSPALNRLANRVESGGKVAATEWAGLYRVRGSMPLNGDTALIIDPDPRGMSAFVRRRGPARGERTDWLNEGPGGRWWFLDQD